MPGLQSHHLRPRQDAATQCPTLSPVSFALIGVCGVLLAINVFQWILHRRNKREIHHLKLRLSPFNQSLSMSSFASTLAMASKEITQNVIAERNRESWQSLQYAPLAPRSTSKVPSIGGSRPGSMYGDHVVEPQAAFNQYRRQPGLDGEPPMTMSPLRPNAAPGQPMLPPSSPPHRATDAQKSKSRPQSSAGSGSDSGVDTTSKPHPQPAPRSAKILTKNPPQPQTNPFVDRRPASSVGFPSTVEGAEGSSAQDAVEDNGESPLIHGQTITTPTAEVATPAAGGPSPTTAPPGPAPAPAPVARPKKGPKAPPINPYLNRRPGSIATPTEDESSESEEEEKQEDVAAAGAKGAKHGISPSVRPPSAVSPLAPPKTPTRTGAGGIVIAPPSASASASALPTPLRMSMISVSGTGTPTSEMPTPTTPSTPVAGYVVVPDTNTNSPSTPNSPATPKVTRRYQIG
ncbi:hypothetical protein M427DRAFT_130752 [Gonapodya prolifera JEL478]|uniref:Uncharacterized protein n=1 Tax=Gonapodya prolifera (strain JEL478) TaxID=1344416 RepID=A0A139AWV3_GONPJ|nr:hypothetical protein M427DRAFT_130752 [Gonapodya prolifera JEL478]|eukprot:KXS21198.1 hypothetical protein M427DRAFT_130752 [Gonapodya prolifera JEL478]